MLDERDERKSQVYLIRCGYIRIPVLVQHLSQGAGCIGLEMA